MKTTRDIGSGREMDGPDTSTARLLAARPFTGPGAGRYMFVRTLGTGGFGEVFLARDKELDRRVAIKIWHRKTRAAESACLNCLEEARMVAKLDHPAIVPVYDVGYMDNGSMFIVSKFIEGETLADRLKREPVTPLVAAEIIARIADALHHAHQGSLVHRDVKPGNILLDLEGRPYLIDFGIALREEMLESDNSLMGTPAYMSPEQARGEGHLIDRRSDIFSLGAILYEMLARRLPFNAKTVHDILEQVETTEPPSPTSLVPDVPAELERICLKAMAKRSRDRFLTARAMAEDLDCFLRRTTELAMSRPRVIPKGLRSFDANDADFFIDLIPGPRDREGVPDVLRVWQNRIVAGATENAFRVGMLYGPSGCGKSSLVKAGLLPRMGGAVASVIIEADATETEHRVEQALRRSVINELPGRELIDLLMSVRKGTADGPAGRKVLIVIDQFEQWLNANAVNPASALVQALRQCDGERLQCLLLVRDDFWLSASRFMAALEIDLDQTRNVAMVDLFDLDHARGVLRKFGVAYGRVHETEETPGERGFLNQAIEELQENGRIIPVRLAVFADMVKNREWSPEHLIMVGGARGLGSVFLDESIGERAANLFLREHQQAARETLSALLPDVGTDIKGGMQSFDALRKQAGAKMAAADFRKLIRTLDQELRLITPVDLQDADSLGSDHTPSMHFYQLTHDFLVPAVRQWLAGKRQATRAGRAQLRLAERAQSWTLERRARFLPDLWEWANILIHTRARNWTPNQRRMMKVANRHHITRVAAVATLAIACLFGYREVDAIVETRNLVRQVVQSEMTALPKIIHDLQPLQRRAAPRLREIVAAAAADTRAGLQARLALLSSDAAVTDDVVSAMLQSRAADVGVIRNLLAPRADSVVPGLWQTALDYRETQPRRLSAAAALAGLAPRDSRWSRVAQQVASWLVTESPVTIGPWMEQFRPVGASLGVPLRARFAGTGKGESALMAAILLAEFNRDNPPALIDLLPTAGPNQIRPILDALRYHPHEALSALSRLYNPALPDTGNAEKRNEHARRQANISLALLELGREADVWPLLRNSPDPRLRFYLIHRAAAAGITADKLLRRLDTEPDTSIRRAILLALGDYPASAVPLAGESGLKAKLEAWYRQDPDSGIHSIVGWLLTRWGHGDSVAALRTELSKSGPVEKTNWYVNSQGVGMAIFRGPIEFQMGTHAPLPSNELQAVRHVREIPRSFAVAMTEVTQGQFDQFLGKTNSAGEKKLLPAVWVTQQNAMRFCRWLSEQEGIPEAQMCYPKPVSTSERIEPVQGYLQRTGYRLPTEGEWEFVCRAGAQTSLPFGESLELMPHYSWFYLNANQMVHSVADLRPNDFGCFDLLGNASEWCQDVFKLYQSMLKDGRIVDLGPARREDWSPEWRSPLLVTRGLTGISIETVQCAHRALSMDTRSPFQGFRVARTWSDK